MSLIITLDKGISIDSGLKDKLQSIVSLIFREEGLVDSEINLRILDDEEMNVNSFRNQQQRNVNFQVSPISTDTNDRVITRDFPHDTSSFGLRQHFDPAGNIEETMNEAMYTNQTFDSSGFHNDTNQHLSNVAPSHFTRQSSNYPELTDAEICSMTGQQLNEYYALVDANQPDPNEITPYSSQPGRISHTIPATAPSDSFSLQNEYTNPYEGTRGAYPDSLFTIQTRCQNWMTQDAGVAVNDVLDYNEQLQQQMAKLQAENKKLKSLNRRPRDGRN